MFTLPNNITNQGCDSNFQVYVKGQKVFFPLSFLSLSQESKAENCMRTSLTGNLFSIYCVYILSPSLILGVISMVYVVDINLLN